MKYFLSFFFVFFWSTWAQFVVPEAPSTPVYDEAGIFSQTEKSTLEQQILTLEAETHHQISVATLSSLQNRTIEEVSIAIARGWGIGQSVADNGLLILLVPSEREVRIEVGRGLEGVITDLTANRIIDENFVPAFQEERYFDGITEGITRMEPLLKGEIVELPKEPTDPFAILFSLVFWLGWGGLFLGSVFFEPSKAWWPGMVVGMILGGVVMLVVSGSMVMIALGIFFSGGVLGGLDFAFSRGIFKALSNSRPHGGRWGGGGGWGGNGGGGWGGFGGGGFSGGGASGKW